MSRSPPRPWILGVTAAVLAVLPFAPSLGGGFVYDDHALIEQKGAVHGLARLPELWQSEFWQGLGPIHFRYLRPLVSTSYAIDWALYGGRPAGFHATNLIVHGLVALLLYATLLRWSLSPWGALVATLAWAWHPTKVEAVSWISGRTDLLASLGILVTCAGVKRRLEGAFRSGIGLEISGLVIAFASKEIAVVVPAFVLVEAWFFFGRKTPGNAELARAASVALPHAIVAALYVAGRFLFLPVVPEGAGSISFVDARLYTFESLGEFARVVLAPFPLSIQRAPIRVDTAMHVLHDPGRLALGVAAALSLFAAWWVMRRGLVPAWRCMGYLLGGAALVPVSNVLSARMVFLFAERFAYAPLVGFALAVVPREKPKAWSIVAWTVVLGTAFALSVVHTRHFLDDRSLWEHELAVNPSDPLALRFACEDAMVRRDHRAAIDFALRGYKGAAGWPVPRPDRAEFAARAARSLELVTLDHDRETLERIVAFYRAFFDERGTARLDDLRIPIAIAADSDDAKNFRRGDPTRVATTKLWASIAASRIERCDFALPMARDYVAAGGDRVGRISAAMALARCSAWSEALDVARQLQAMDPALAELTDNIAWARTVTGETPDNAEGALRSSRAQTMLLQRGRAYAVLVPFEREILSDPQASVFFARAAWAAGEDDAARRGLAPHMSEPDVAALLASWSRELGRE